MKNSFFSAFLVFAACASHAPNENPDGPPDSPPQEIVKLGSTPTRWTSSDETPISMTLTLGAGDRISGTLAYASESDGSLVDVGDVQGLIIDGVAIMSFEDVTTFRGTFSNGVFEGTQTFPTIIVGDKPHAIDVRLGGSK